ncbi:MAG: molybdopterin-dependent oxidoreductase, partial [Chloroflexi bacterium]|nr:molybdopterin-dependent oxidoreductase [Chloroflexota bacterium]
LVILADQPTKMDDWAIARWTLAEADRALRLAAEAQMPAILYTPEGATLAETLAAQLPRAKRVPLAPLGNALGLAKAGFAGFDGQKAAAYVVVAGEASAMPAPLAGALEKAAFVVAQASYREPWDQVADVLLPMPTTFEKSGTTVNTEGHEYALSAAVKVTLPSVQEMATQLGQLL